MEEVCNILRTCGITSKYKGYDYIKDVSHLLYQKYRTTGVLEFDRSMYQTIADKYDVPISLIERNIKTVIERCIANKRQFVEDILGYKIIKSPKNSEFLESLVLYVIDIIGWFVVG